VDVVGAVVGVINGKNQGVQGGKRVSVGKDTAGNKVQARVGGPVEGHGLPAWVWKQFLAADRSRGRALGQPGGLEPVGGACGGAVCAGGAGQGGILEQTQRDFNLGISAAAHW